MTIEILQGDCLDVLKTLPSESVHCCVTSPPYFCLRNYGVDGQIGLEKTPEAYIAKMVDVFREVRRLLRSDGVLWLNIGDSYAGGTSTGRNDGGRPEKGRGWAEYDISKKALQRNDGIPTKNLLMIPAMLALALRADGWWLRSDCIWAKPNPMPESVTDRPTSAHEHVFLLTKSSTYFYDAEAVKEEATAAGRIPGGNHKVDASRNDAGRDMSVPVADFRNLRNVWTIATEPSSIPHFAMMPTKLAEICIKAGCPEGGTVLDPFGGVGTTGIVARLLKRNSILIELNPESIEHARRRIEGWSPIVEQKPIDDSLPLFANEAVNIK